MSFGQLNHSRQAIRCDPIICGYYFAVLAARRNCGDGDVMVANGIDKSRIRKDPHTGIAACIAIRDTEGAICTAVVDNDVLPVGVTLGENTLDTLSEESLAVIDWSHNTYEGFVVHSLP